MEAHKICWLDGNDHKGVIYAWGLALEGLLACHWWYIFSTF
jgi:hypothetical protein